MSLLSTIAGLGGGQGSDSYINRLLNSTLPTAWTATAPYGFNEFDIIDAGDGSGDYELFFDDRSGTRYIRFHNASDLQGLITAGSDVVIKSGHRFPSVIKAAGTYYCYGYNGTTTQVLVGANIAELQAISPIDLGITALDFAVRVNPAGGYMATAQLEQAKFYTSSSLTSGWVDRGFIYAPSGSQELQPTYARNQADSTPYEKNGNVYVLSNGIPLDHRETPPTSHEIVSKMDMTSYRAIGTPSIFLDPSLASFHQYTVTSSGDIYKDVANPVPIYIQGREEIWYIGGSTGTTDTPGPGSIAHYVVSDNIGSKGIGGKGVIVKVVPGKTTDLANNSIHKTYGTITNTVDGITTNTTASGLWNFVSVENLIQFDLGCSFKVTTFPTGSNYSTVFHLYAYQKGTAFPELNELNLRVYASGVLKLVFTDFSGAVTTWVVSNPVTLNTQYDFTLHNTYSGSNTTFLINGTDSHTILNGMGQTGIYSLFNDKTDLLTAANQMYGTIYSFTINLLS